MKRALNLWVCFAFAAALVVSSCQQSPLVPTEQETGVAGVSYQKLGGSPGVQAASVTVQTSAYYVVGVLGKFIGTAEPNADITAKVDGFALTFAGGATSVKAGADGKYAFSYTFSSAKDGRKLDVFASSGGTTTSTTKTINVKPAGTTPAADPVDYSLTVNVPSNIRANTPVTFTGTASANVAKISATADGFSIANNVAVSGGAWSFDISFNTPRMNRVLVVTAFDASGTALGTVTKNFDVLSDGFVIQNVPYFYQGSNAIDPCCTCQNTSAAMILKFYGATSITPDQLTSRWTRKKGQTVAGLAELCNIEANERGVKVKDVASMNNTLADLQNHLKTGNPCIVHGWFTSSGHIMVVTGYDGTHYYCNDPAGKWNLVNGSGYFSSSTIGNGVKYPKADFERAIVDASGVWLHRFYRTN